MIKTIKHQFDKKTFNINREYSQLMKDIVPSRKQTDFVNRAIKHELERIQESLKRQQILKSLSSLRKKRESLPKPTHRSEDIVRKLREFSVNQKYQASITDSM